MKISRFFVVVLFFFIVPFGFCQTKAPSLIVENLSPDDVFDSTVDFLIDSDYFIKSMDRNAGFIQVKIIDKSKKILSTRRGQRTTFNLVLRPTEVALTTLISLQANVEELVWNGEVDADMYYYKDEGRVRDSRIYEELLDVLQEYFDNI